MYPAGLSWLTETVSATLTTALVIRVTPADQEGSTMTEMQSVATLTTDERDRRYRVLRTSMAERGIDAAIATRSNSRYLTGGLPGELHAVLPANSDALPTAFINSRYLSDMPVQVLLDAQQWITDIRPAGDMSVLADCLRAVVAPTGTIAFDAGISHLFYEQLRQAFPGVQFVDASDVFADARAVKSEEEVRLIERAGDVFQAAIDAVHRVARPGHSGAFLVQQGIRAMWEAGGDMNTTFSLSLGPVPKQNPAIAALSLHRTVNPGDMLTLTGHAMVGGYAAHSDQEISVGRPTMLHQEMFDAVVSVRERVLAHVKPGVRHSELENVYREAVAQTGFRASPHSQIHQFGMDVPEHPGTRFAVPDADGNSGRRRDFILVSGMVYSISPTLLAPDGEDTILGGTSLVVTEDGHRPLETRPVEMLVVDA
jgi:Xaa-Pro aminopeptidase